MIIKPTGTEVSIATQNSVSNASLVRIINTGAAAVCNVEFANATVYASFTVSNTESVILQKSPTDLIVGPNMKAVSVAYKS